MDIGTDFLRSFYGKKHLRLELDLTAAASVITREFKLHVALLLVVFLVISSVSVQENLAITHPDIGFSIPCYERKFVGRHILCADGVVHRDNRSIVQLYDTGIPTISVKRGPCYHNSMFVIPGFAVVGTKKPADAVGFYPVAVDKMQVPALKAGDIRWMLPVTGYTMWR